jgi:hypothetical protein
MAVQVIIEWEGVTPGQYEQARHLVRWDVETPPGLLFHVSAFDGKGLRITDVWESAEHFQSFTENQLIPGTKQVGIPGEPKVEIYPAHAVLAPGYHPR